MRLSSIVLRAAAGALLVLPLIATRADAQPWRRDVSCTAGTRAPLTSAGTPAETAVAGCARAYCVSLPDGRRVCSCYGDDNEMRVEQAGRVVNRWPVSWMGTSGETFDVLRGDLDGDGHEELTVASLETVGNGLGVHHWTVATVDGRDPSRVPAQLSVKDWDRAGSMVRAPSGGTCRLLATDWAELRDPRRGAGTYFTAQWMRYADGGWSHDTSRPMVARRLLNSFRRDAAGSPYAAFRDARSEARTGTARFNLPPIAADHRVTLVSLGGDTVVVRLGDGSTRTYAAGAGLGFYEQQATFRQVDSASGRAYPGGWRPRDAASWTGRTARLRVYADREGIEIHHLVL